MNPWHDIEPGKRAPEIVECIIEVPRGSRNKYELDKKSGLLRLDRVLYSAVFYPANYGFIPCTYCDDSDPLDILVLGQEPVVPMCIVTARPIGVMQMVDENEEDDKIIAIHEHDPAFTHYRDISHLPEHTLDELQRFFEDYKVLEHKKVRIEHFRGRVDAHNIILNSMRLYDETFKPEKQAADQLAEQQKEERTETERQAVRSPSRAVRLEAARRAAARLTLHGGSSSPELGTAPAEGTSGVTAAGAGEAREPSESAGQAAEAEPKKGPKVTVDARTLNAYAVRSKATPEPSANGKTEA